MFFYVLYDLSHRINFADLTPRRHWGWFARLCRSDLHLGPQPFQGTGPQHTKIQRLCMPSTSQYSISPDLLKESLVSEEWKRWIENKEKFRADLVGGSAEGQKSNCVCRGQAFTTLSCWFEVFDHFRVNGVDTWLLMIKHGRSSRCHALPKRDSGAPLLLKAHESKDFDLSIFFETPILFLYLVMLAIHGVWTPIGCNNSMPLSGWTDLQRSVQLPSGNGMRSNRLVREFLSLSTLWTLRVFVSLCLLLFWPLDLMCFWRHGVLRWIDLLVTSNQAYQAVLHRASTEMKFSSPNCVNPNERWFSRIPLCIFQPMIEL